MWVKDGRSKGALLGFKPSSKKGFTLAEVLITVMIIGIVAAISIPSLIENVSERVWDSQRKVLHLRLTEALSMMPKLDGFGTKASDAAAAFITGGLSKYYKMGGICSSSGALDVCGLPSTFTDLQGDASYDFPTTLSNLNYSSSHMKTTITGTNVEDTAAAAFKTTNGESIAVFYNPDCGAKTSSVTSISTKVCVNFIYDLNGSEGPNQIGKDMGFITAFYKKSPEVVAPMPYPDNPGYSKWKGALEICTSVDEDLRLPTREEAAALWYNAKLTALEPEYSTIFLTGTPAGSIEAYYIDTNKMGIFQDIDTMEEYDVLCVYN